MRSLLNYHMTKEKQKICCLCNKKYSGFGNNALPIKKGKCCDMCNALIILDRLKILKLNKKNNMNSLTWIKLKKHKEAKERIERIKSTFEKLAVILCYFSLGYFIGRMIEVIIVGCLNFYY